jgi:hypothetical protein
MATAATSKAASMAACMHGMRICESAHACRGCGRGNLSRHAAKVTNYFSAVCCTSVTTPSCRTFSRARGVFIFVRNFSRGIFLRDSLSKVVEVLTACTSISRDEIKGASSLGRVDLDLNCIVSYLTHCLLVSWLILLYETRNMYGAPEWIVRYFSYLLSTWAKWKTLVHISISLSLKSYGGSYGEFSELGFPHNFAPQKKEDRHDLKMGCIDVSRRQLQSVLKIGVWTDFLTKLWLF